MTSPVPEALKADNPIKVQPVANDTRLRLRPNPTLRSDSQRPTGHCSNTRSVSWKAIRALL